MLPRSRRGIDVRTVILRGSVSNVIRGRLWGRPHCFAEPWSAMPPFFVLIAILLIFSTTNSALASWWLVRSSEGKCLVVNIEPTDQDKTVTKIGNEAYQSADQAERDAKRLCKDAKPGEQSAPHPK
jgi:hypothetical protein